MEYNICAPVFVNSLLKCDKMLSMHHILFLLPNSFNKFNNTYALILDPHLFFRLSDKVVCLKKHTIFFLFLNQNIGCECSNETSK